MATATSTLRPAPVSTAQFTFDARQARFVAEISDLGRGFTFGRVWDDSVDEGLTLVSTRTGDEIVFVVDDEIVRDGEIRYWKLIPAVAPFTYTMIVFNT